VDGWSLWNSVYFAHLRCNQLWLSLLTVTYFDQQQVDGLLKHDVTTISTSTSQCQKKAIFGFASRASRQGKICRNQKDTDETGI
jgi:hypothetical protein